MKATITITEQQLEALNQLVTNGLYCLDDRLAERCPDVRIAHEWLTEARQALVAAQADEYVGPISDKARRAADQAVADARNAGWPQDRIDRLEDSVFHHEMGAQMFGIQEEEEEEEEEEVDFISYEVERQMGKRNN